MIFGPAQISDDAALRQLLRDTPMPGDIAVAFSHEPDYFAAASIQGHRVETYTAREDERIIAIGTRAEKEVFVDGFPARIGYLSGLRIHPAHRSGTVLARAYRQLRRAHEAGSVPYYLTTIIADNAEARAMLTSGRAGLPTYRDIGAYHTLAIRPSGLRGPQLPVRPATKADQDALIAFLHRHGPQRQFFPHYQSADFANGLLRGLRIEDVLLLVEDGSIVGCLALWDQRAFKQNIVSGYSRRLALARPGWNLYATLTGRPTLPRTGQALAQLHLALCCVADDCPATFESLLHAALARASTPLVLAGFHERDSLLPIAAACPHRRYLSRLYQVYWEEPPAIDARVPYLELGGL